MPAISGARTQKSSSGCRLYPALVTKGLNIIFYEENKSKKQKKISQDIIRIISTSDSERPSHPKEVTSQEMIDKIHDIVLNDRRLKVREISETVNILVGRVWYISHEFLGMRKLSARWVPRLLTANHKSGLVWLRLSNVGACFNVIQRNFCEFM